MPKKNGNATTLNLDAVGPTKDIAVDRRKKTMLKAGALQSAIFNSANFSSIATDAKGVIQIFNVGAERMLGYAAAEVMNKITPADISDPQEVIARAKELSIELGTPITPGFEALVFKASRGIEDIYELTYIRKDGSRFPAVVSVTALRDAQDAIIGYLLIGTDNTARKQVEAEQKKLDQRLRDYQFYTRSLFESNIDALMTTDPSGIITDVNKQMEALTGFTRDELIGAPFKNYCTDPEVAEASIKMVLLEKKVSNYELTVRAWDGKETVVSYNATTFYDRNRNLQGVFAAARDVTERKRTDAALLEKTRQLEELTHDLERRVKEEVELRFRNEQILIQQSKLAAMGEMLGAISHQWRQPLNALGLIIQDIQEAYTCGEINQEYISDSVQKSMAQIQHMSKTINDFRNFFSPDKEKTQFDTMRAVGDVLILLSAQLSANGIGYRLTCHIQGHTYDNEADIVISKERMIVGYHNEFKHVVLNIINNAREAIVSRLSRVASPTAFKGRIDFDFWQQENAILIEVGDNGGGIDPRVMDRIFEPYFTTKDPAKGTGLGLYMSKVIMEQMSGTLSMRNSEHGAVFVLTLPRPNSEFEPGAGR